MAQKSLNPRHGHAKMFPVKMPDSLIDLIRDAARLRGLTVSEYARTVLEKDACRVTRLRNAKP